MKLYTRTGDTGQTALFTGQRVSKDDPRIEACGTLDELNAALGLAVAECPRPELREVLVKLQRQLFDVGADLATPQDQAAKAAAGHIPRVDPAHIAFLEAQVDAANAQLPPLKRFILPGGTRTAAELHVARTICRRAERLVVALARHEALGEHLVPYLNRLSDLLFVLARLANRLAGQADVEWEADRP